MTNRVRFIFSSPFIQRFLAQRTNCVRRKFLPLPTRVSRDHQPSASRTACFSGMPNSRMRACTAGISYSTRRGSQVRAPGSINGIGGARVAVARLSHRTGIEDGTRRHLHQLDPVSALPWKRGSSPRPTGTGIADARAPQNRKASRNNRNSSAPPAYSTHIPRSGHAASRVPGSPRRASVMSSGRERKNSMLSAFNTRA